MLTDNLNKAIEELDCLIDFTKEDIRFAKEANHNALADRHITKERMLSRFEMTKSDLNSELLKLSNKSDGDLSKVIDTTQSGLLDEFKERLVLLKELNRDFMAIVIVVNEFYQSLFSKMFKFDTNGYNKTKPLSAAMLKVSA